MPKSSTNQAKSLARECSVDCSSLRSSQSPSHSLRSTTRLRLVRGFAPKPHGRLRLPIALRARGWLRQPILPRGMLRIPTTELRSVVGRMVATRQFPGLFHSLRSFHYGRELSLRSSFGYAKGGASPRIPTAMLRIARRATPFAPGFACRECPLA